MKLKKIYCLRLFVFAFLISAGIQNVAQASVSIVQSENGKVILQGTSFEELAAEIQDINLWGSTDAKIQCSVKNVVNKADNNWAVDISDCLPRHASDLLNKSPKYDGPNCYNLVLNYQAVTTGLYDSSYQELDAYVNSPLCRELSPTESVMPGDLGIIKDGIGYIHGFIYATKNIAYTKNGITKDNPYQLQNLKEVFDLYHVGIKTSENKESECYRSNEPECQEFIAEHTYRCVRFSTLELNKNKQSQYSQSVLYWLQRIAALESLYKDIMFISPVSLDREKMIRQTQATAEKILADLAKAKKIFPESLNDYDRFLQNLILAKTDNFSYIYSLPPLQDRKSNWPYLLHSKISSYLE